MLSSASANVNEEMYLDHMLLLQYQARDHGYVSFTSRIALRYAVWILVRTNNEGVACLL